MPKVSLRKSYSPDPCPGAPLELQTAPRQYPGASFHSLQQKCLECRLLRGFCSPGGVDRGDNSPRGIKSRCCFVGQPGKYLKIFETSERPVSWTRAERYRVKPFVSFVPFPGHSFEGMTSAAHVMKSTHWFDKRIGGHLKTSQIV